MRTSDKIDLLAAALCKAQAAMSPASKDAENGHFRSKYADLASAWLAAQKPITDNGLSIVQGFEPGVDKALIIKTMLIHISGQWIESTLVFYPLDQKPQTLGSCITYGRRYSLMAILGIVPDEDDDGNAASRVPPQAPPPQARQRSPNTQLVASSLESPPILFDMNNQHHRNGLAQMLKLNFQTVPSSLYPSIAQACHGKPAHDDILKQVVFEFLKNAGSENHAKDAILVKMIAELEQRGISISRVTGKSALEIYDLDGQQKSVIMAKIQQVLKAENLAGSPSQL